MELNRNSPKFQLQIDFFILKTLRPNFEIETHLNSLKYNFAKSQPNQIFLGPKRNKSFYVRVIWTKILEKGVIIIIIEISGKNRGGVEKSISIIKAKDSTQTMGAIRWVLQRTLLWGLVARIVACIKNLNQQSVY